MAGQKSGIAYAVDPDTGELRWQHRAGRGGMSGGIHFGMAASKGRLFIPVSDLPDGQPSDFPLSPGIYAVDVATGNRLWSAPAPNPCEGRPGCVTGYGASIMATEDLVIAGSDDGFLRILDAGSGKLVAEFDTAREFDAVGGGKARGGAISGSGGAVLDQGQLIVSSGYGFVSKMPGNLLLVLEAE
jgi:polyvinyl alcohol dehydrogenase (cytochrome)